MTCMQGLNTFFLSLFPAPLAYCFHNCSQTIKPVFSRKKKDALMSTSTYSIPLSLGHTACLFSVQLNDANVVHCGGETP